MSEENSNPNPEYTWKMFVAAYPMGTDREFNSIETTSVLHKYYNSNQEHTTNKFELEQILIQEGYKFTIIAGEKHWYIM